MNKISNLIINPYLMCISLVLILLFTLNYLLFLPVVLLVLLIFYQSRNDLLVLGIIISFVVLTDTVVGDIRIIITIFFTILLVVLFVKRYGLEINQFPKVPKESAVVIIIIFISFAVTAFHSNSTASLEALSRFFIFLLICYLIYSFIDSKEMVIKYILSIIIAGLVTSFSLYFDFIKGGFELFLISGFLARYTGIYGNPNFIGLLFVIITILTVAAFLSDLFKTKGQRLFLYFVLINNFIIFLITGSRAAIISLILGISFVLIVLKGKIFIKLILTICTSLMVLFQIPFTHNFLLLFLKLQDTKARDDLWYSGMEMFKKNFIFGVGPDEFPNHFYTFFPSNTLYKFIEAGALDLGKRPSPHNFFIFMAAENGIIGLISSILLFIVFFYLAFKTMIISKNINKNTYILSIAIIGIGIAVIFRCFFEVGGILSYGYLSRDLPFWLIFIILSYVYKIMKSKQKEIVG